jgi:hypothetical protein
MDGNPAFLNQGRPGSDFARELEFYQRKAAKTIA